jgi:hypothetical protein
MNDFLPGRAGGAPAFSRTCRPDIAVMRWRFDGCSNLLISRHTSIAIDPDGELDNAYPPQSRFDGAFRHRTVILTPLRETTTMLRFAAIPDAQNRSGAPRRMTARGSRPSRDMAPRGPPPRDRAPMVDGLWERVPVHTASVLMESWLVLTILSALSSVLFAVNLVI